MNVKAYQDGTRFVMVFEDCTPDITECLKAFIKPVMEAKAEVKPMKKEVIIKASGYDGMTIAQCLEEKKDAGYAAIAHMMQDFSEEERPIVEENLSNYIKERFLGIDPYEFAEKLTDKQCAIFFKQFLHAAAPYMKPISEQAGYASFKEFIEKAPLEQKRSAVAAVIEKIK